jgi:hypothetical protein
VSIEEKKLEPPVPLLPNLRDVWRDCHVYSVFYYSGILCTTDFGGPMTTKTVWAKKTLASAMLMAGACPATGRAVSKAANKSDAPSNPLDPCFLVTAADLCAALGASFSNAHGSENVDSRDCEYDSDKLLVGIVARQAEADASL